MMSTKELYDIDPVELSQMSYKSALMLKLSQAKSRLNELYELKPWYEFSNDEYRLSVKLLEAIEFNKFLLEEVMYVYNLEGKSLNELKALKELIETHPELTVEEKRVNLARINSKLDPSKNVKVALSNFIEGQADLSPEVD